MKVFLRKDVEKVGMAGEIVKVSEGYARNFLFPRDLAVEITADNEKFYANRVRVVEHRKDVIATKSSMLAEKIETLKVTIKKKTHAQDSGSKEKLYGAVSTGDVVEALAQRGINVTKSQIVFDKSIKTLGVHEVTVKLTTRLQPKVKVNVVAE